MMCSARSFVAKLSVSNTVSKTVSKFLSNKTRLAFGAVGLQVLLVFGFVSVLGQAAQARVETVIGSQDIQSNPNLPGYLPSVSSNEILISRPQYIISYNRDRRAPNWVAWKVDESQLGSVQRSNHFQLDSELENYLQSSNPSGKPAVSPTEYKKTCYDRGHQSPSGDHTATPEDNEATFMMSNMIPQTAYLNRVIWEHLEEHTRDLVRQESKVVYVVAGPIYDRDYGMIGPNHDIPVPSKNFKVLMILDSDLPFAQRLKSATIESVIMPNVLAGGADPTDQSLRCSQTLDVNSFSKDDWKQYQVPVKTIESIAGVVLH